MLLETLLPLGKVDPGLRAPEMPLDLHSIAADARLLEEIGYDGLVVEETKDDPFILLSLAAQTTRTIFDSLGIPRQRNTQVPVA